MAGAFVLNFELVIAFFLTAIGIEISKWLRIPSSVGLIIFGMVFGPSILGILNENEIIHFLAEIGIVLLLFHVGLENELSLLKEKSSIVVGILGMVIPFIIGFLTALIFANTLNFSITESILIGVICTATSIGITTAILKESGTGKRNFTKTILGAAVADDVLGLIALSVFITISTAENFNPFEITLELALSLVILIVSIYLGIQFMRLIKTMSRAGLSDSTLYILGISLALFAAVTAENIGLSGIVGAFLIGLLIRSQRLEKEAEDLLHSFHTLVAIFSPLFFLNLGLQVDYNSLIAGFGFGLILTIGAILSKFIGSYYGAQWTGIDKHSSLIIAVGMVPRGEVALIAANIGFALGLIDSTIFSAIIVMSLLTSFLPPLVLASLLKPYIVAKDIEELEEMTENMSQKWSMYNMAGYYKFVETSKGNFRPFSEKAIRERIKRKGGDEQIEEEIISEIKNRLSHQKRNYIHKSYIDKLIEKRIKTKV